MNHGIVTAIVALVAGGAVFNFAALAVYFFAYAKP